MKIGFILLAIAVLIGIVLFLRSQTPPKFYIQSTNILTKTGEFVFDGHQNSFGLGKGISVSGRNGYVVTASTNASTVVFKLYKNGTFLKDLKTITF